MFPEAAVRSQKQAESEDCDQVDIEHFEKILPQLVGVTTETNFCDCNCTVAHYQQRWYDALDLIQSWTMVHFCHFTSEHHKDQFIEDEGGS